MTFDFVCLQSLSNHFLCCFLGHLFETKVLLLFCFSESSAASRKIELRSEPIESISGFSDGFWFKACIFDLIWSELSALLKYMLESIDYIFNLARASF